MQIVVFLCVACVGLVAALQVHGPQMTDAQLDQTLADKNIMQRHIKCALGEGPCDPVGRRLRIPSRPLLVEVPARAAAEPVALNSPFNNNISDLIQPVPSCCPPPSDALSRGPYPTGGALSAQSLSNFWLRWYSEEPARNVRLKKRAKFDKLSRLSNGTTLGSGRK